ncbi:MAG: amidophosphoribosyltransferase [Deltaproteobacteria bacterium]|nr:MAG: amidophosphoribosyltransferase [Deltaproteobacteria bacterium]
MKIKDNCGVFGIYSNKDCVRDILQGIHLLQHRGQRYGGVATYNKKNGIRIITHRGWVEQKEQDHAFRSEEIKELRANFGIGHVSLKDRQPFLPNIKFNAGDFTVGFSGKIINAQRLRNMLKKEEGLSFNTDIGIIAQLIGRHSDIPSGIEQIYKQIKGSFALTVLTGEGIYCARDPYGLKPLILGNRDGTYAGASESRALQNLGIPLRRDVLPGEIIFIDKNGFKVLKKLKGKRRAYCAFEWAYIASMDSIIDGIPVKRARLNLGAKLARRDRIKADLVAGVPMSGIGHALGYHYESGIRYDDVYLYNRYSDRSYTPLEQKARDAIAKIKLSVIKDSVKGKRIVLCDDSIVRGTQIREKVKELKAAGVREVHVRVASPPLMAPCDYGLSTRSYRELIAINMSIEKIRRYIGATTLKYNALSDFVEAIGKPADELCLKCWTNEPVF